MDKAVGTALAGGPFQRRTERRREEISEAGAKPRHLRSEARSDATFCNPVINHDFPDPCVIRGGDGLFYAYATQGIDNGESIYVQAARSPDLVNWTLLGEALAAPPKWAEPGSAIMAPNAISADGRIFLYFAARPKDADGMGIGVAVADNPAGPFEPQGDPIIAGERYDNIDPFPFDSADGRLLLFWGSGSIKVRELGSDRCSFAPGSETITLLRPSPGATSGYQRLVEAAAIVNRGGRHYLFYSGDNCCHGNPHYAVMLARSEKVTGPYERLTQPDSEEHLLLQSRGRWKAPGHCTVVRDDAGDNWILYHAIDKRHSDPLPESEDKEARRVLLLDRLRWRGGWPVSDGPTEGPQPAPVVEPQALRRKASEAQSLMGAKGESK